MNGLELIGFPCVLAVLLVQYLGFGSFFEAASSLAARCRVGVVQEMHGASGIVHPDSPSFVCVALDTFPL